MAMCIISRDARQVFDFYIVKIYPLLHSGKSRGKKSLGPLRNISENVSIFKISGHAKNNVPQNHIAFEKWT
jgi:hypothetical protein